MKQFLKNINQFLVSNTVWIYLVLFFFVSYLLIITAVKDNWSNYLFYGCSLCLLYFPILLFAFFRRQINQRFPFWVVGLIWGICFLAYPAMLYICKDMYFENLFSPEVYSHPNENIPAFRQGFLLSLTSCVIATEIAILSNNHLLNWIQQQQWTRRFNTEQMIMFILGLFALIFSALRVFEWDDFQSIGKVFQNLFYWFWSAIQLFGILMSYYFFYYFNRYFLIPKILKTKGVIYYGFAFAGTILLFYPIFVALIKELPYVADFQLSNYTIASNTFAGDGAALPFFILLLSVPIVVSFQWFQQNNQIVSLEKEKTETELSLLKQQINPHFFFNTLNNLYALSITKDEQTPEVILQLSELMRYVIYKGKEDFVPLQEEVKYIEDYIQLQQIRLHKKLDFSFEKNIENEHLLVPPLLFITFVENAFKHGIEPAEEACYLHLRLINKANKLEFSCENSMEEKSTGAPGIGLENLKKRLSLRYPKRHEMDVSETAKSYRAKLIIQ